MGQGSNVGARKAPCSPTEPLPHDGARLQRRSTESPELADGALTPWWARLRRQSSESSEIEAQPLLTRAQERARYLEEPDNIPTQVHTGGCTSTTTVEHKGPEH